MDVSDLPTHYLIFQQANNKQTMPTAIVHNTAI